MQENNATVVMQELLKNGVEIKIKLKESKEGEDGMNALLEKYMEKSRLEGIKEGKIEGEEIGRAKEIIRMSRRFNISDCDIQKELRNALQISQEAAKKYMESFAEIN